jgi:starch-binding outer membrane protein, SusD/RagB family
MKKRTWMAGVVALSLTVTGCDDDYLMETPIDFVGPENFYRNAGDALAAVNAAYATFITLQSPLNSSDYVGRNLWMIVEYQTEVATSRLSATNERSLVDNYHTQFSPSHAYLLGVWRAAYSGINRANSVIARVPAVGMDTVRRAQIVGEAKFLRALHYYFLAGLFGGVPLKLNETIGLDSLELPRATGQETFAQIEKDLTEAAAVLPVSWPASDWGRATRGAANALLAKSILQRAGMGFGTPADYSRAADLLRALAGSGTYRLDANYASLFDGSNERSQEIIFSLQNVRVDGYGGRLSEWFSPVTVPVIMPGPQNQFQAELPFFNSYAANDVRKAGTWLLSFNKGGTTISWPATPTTASLSAQTGYGSTGPVPRKYLDLLAADGGMEEPDVILLRYADVLLLLAEAINEAAGPTTEAYAAINQVRTRAGLGNLTSGLSKDEFRNAVFLERRFELALEMSGGLFDNRRNWPWAKARIEAHMAVIGTANRSPTTSAVTKFNAAPIPDKWKLFPIPQRAMDLNPKLRGAQNPGW